MFAAFLNLEKDSKIQQQQHQEDSSADGAYSAPAAAADTTTPAAETTNGPAATTTPSSSETQTQGTTESSKQRRRRRRKHKGGRKNKKKKSDESSSSDGKSKDGKSADAAAATATAEKGTESSISSPREEACVVVASAAAMSSTSDEDDADPHASPPSASDTEEEEDDADKNNNKMDNPDGVDYDSDNNDNEDDEDDTIVVDGIPLSSPKLQLSNIEEDDDGEKDEEDDDDDDEPPLEKKPMKLYKSSRLKAYMTLTFSSGICWSSAVSSTNTINKTVVPATASQQKYAMAVSVVSICIVGPILAMHLDSFTPLERFWIAAFKSRSKIELALALVLILWWSVAVGVQTSIAGVAGDGKGQVSLYFSSWVSCWASWWILERWWVAAGYSSFKSFITSWPYRAPGWICIFITGIFTLIWYLDLWENHEQLANRKSEANLYAYFSEIGLGQWRLLVSLVSLTILPSAVFVVAEIARETKPDGSTGDKFRAETIAEGVCLLLLILTWIPVIMLATTPGGAASQVGNAYFFSWILVVFVAETGVWFVHDLREKMHKSLRQRTEEYQERQRKVLQQTRAIQAQKLKQAKKQQAAARKRANSSGGSSMAASNSGHDQFPDYNESGGSHDDEDDDSDFSDFDRNGGGGGGDEKKKDWAYPGSTEFFDAVP